MTEGTQTLNEILRTLSANQLDFVAQRMAARTDKEAAEAIDIPQSSVYNWPNKPDVNRAVQLAKLDSVEVGREKLRRLVNKAVDVLDTEMGSGKKRRLDAAQDVLDRTGLEAVSGVKVSGEVETGGPLLAETIATLEEYKRARSKTP